MDAPKAVMPGAVPRWGMPSAMGHNKAMQAASQGMWNPQSRVHQFAQPVPPPPVAPFLQQTAPMGGMTLPTPTTPPDVWQPPQMAQSMPLPAFPGLPQVSTIPELVALIQQQTAADVSTGGTGTGTGGTGGTGTNADGGSTGGTGTGTSGTGGTGTGGTGRTNRDTDPFGTRGR